jgi:hypothetical protein
MMHLCASQYVTVHCCMRLLLPITRCRHAVGVGFTRVAYASCAVGDFGALSGGAGE